MRAFRITTTYYLPTGVNPKDYDQEITAQVGEFITNIIKTLGLGESDVDGRWTLEMSPDIDENGGNDAEAS